MSQIIIRPPESLSISQVDPETWAVAQKQQRAYEDRFQVRQLGPFRYFAVFDGHGAAKYIGGDHVVDYAMDVLHERLAFKLNQIDYNSTFEVINVIERVFIDFDKELLFNELQFGCTCTMILIHDKMIYQVNLGDSRSLIFSRKELLSSSKDHCPTNEEERDRINAAGGYISYGRIDGNIAVSRAFGDFEFKTTMTLSYDPINGKMSTVPDVKALQLSPPLFILLTSDGAFDSYSNESMVQFVQEGLDNQKSLAIIVQELVNSAAAQTTDDTTIILVAV